MSRMIEPKELAFDAYTLCSFVPDRHLTRAMPLVVIGYNDGEDPSFVWLVPKEGIDPRDFTSDPYYARILRDPHAYFRKKVAKYVEKSGSVRRGIETLIACHQEQLNFTDFIELNRTPTRPLELQFALS